MSTGSRTVLNGRKIRVLYAGDMEFARAQFASEAPQLQLVAAADALSATAPAGANGSPEIAFIDCGAPGVNAANLLEQLRARPVAIPTVLALDSNVENCERVAVDLQADDYTVKTPGWLGRLPTRLAMVIARHENAQSFQAVRTREERLRRIVESAPVCLVRVRADGTIVAANDAARAMLGVTKSEDVLRKPVFTFVATDDADPLRKLIASVCGGRPGSIEFSVTGPYGSPRAVETRGVVLPPDATGEPSALLTLRDISERKRLESSVLENVRAGADDTGTRVRVLELDSKVAGLEKKLAEAEMQRTAAVSARDAAAATCDQLRNEVDALKLAAGAANSQETAALRQQLAERESAHHAAAEMLRTLEGQRAQLEAQHAQLQAQHAQTVNAHEQSLAAYQEALAAKAMAEGALADAQARLAAESEADRASREGLEASRAALAAELRASQQTLSSTEAQLAELRALDSAVQAAQLGLQRALQEATASRDAAEAARTALAAERDAALTARDQALAARDAALTARDQALASIDQAASLRDQAAALRDRAVADRDLAAAARDQALAARDEAAAARQLLADRLHALEADQASTLEARHAAERALASAEARHAAEIAAGRAAREVLDTHLKRVEEERSRLAQASLARAAEHAQGAGSAEVAACRTTISSLEVQLRERQREYADALAERDRLRDQLQAAGAQAPDVDLARAAFSQALTLASPTESAEYKSLAERLEKAEAACRRAEAERDEVIDLRRRQAEELTRALKQSAEYERLATDRMETCAALERSLQSLRDELDDLSEWARIRSARAAEALTSR